LRPRRRSNLQRTNMYTYRHVYEMLNSNVVPNRLNWGLT